MKRESAHAWCRWTAFALTAAVTFSIADAMLWIVAAAETFSGTYAIPTPPRRILLVPAIALALALAVTLLLRAKGWKTVRYRWTLVFPATLGVGAFLFVLFSLASGAGSAEVQGLGAMFGALAGGLLGVVLLFGVAVPATLWGLLRPHAVASKLSP